VSPVHDLAIKDNDLVIATHGRSFWILDDISPLREITPQTGTAAAHLFKPATAIRIRANTNHDTPLPPEVPAGENPPPGAILYYYLKSGSQSEVRLEILDQRGQLVRAYSSSDRPWAPPNPPTFPNYWFRPPEQVSTEAGMHRLVWDLRYTQPQGSSALTRNAEYSMSTVYGQNVAHEPQGPYALPGNYQVRLTVGGNSYTQPLKLVMDPRVEIPAADLEKQFALEMRLEDALLRADQVLAKIQQLYQAKAVPADKASLLSAIEPPPEDRAPGGNPTLTSLTVDAAQLMVAIDSADAAPTLTESAAAEKTLSQIDRLLRQWQAFQGK
jgi:hypothetical protein